MPWLARPKVAARLMHTFKHMYNVQEILPLIPLEEL